MLYLMGIAAAAAVLAYVLLVIRAGWHLSPRELPGAAAAWLAGGDQRRRLLSVIERRAERLRDLPPGRLPEGDLDGLRAHVLRVREERRFPVASPEELQATVTFLVAHGDLLQGSGFLAGREPCPCPGCEAGRARARHETVRRHDPGCGSSGTVCATGVHVRTENGWAGL